jgi:hypothetical protein
LTGLFDLGFQARQFGSLQNPVSDDLSGRKLLNLKGYWMVIREEQLTAIPAP